MQLFSRQTTRKALLACFAGSLLFWQCSSPNSADKYARIKTLALKTVVGKDTLVTLQIKEVTDTLILNLSELANEPEIIQLEDTPEAYVKSNNFTVSSNYILIYGGYQAPVKLFERKTGKFIIDVGAVGRGPGEYLNVYSAQIDEPNGRIYVLPWTQKQVLAYGLDGKAITPIPTPYPMPKGILNINSQDQSITIGVVPFEGIQSAVWKQDLTGKLLSEAPAGHLTVVPDFSNEVMSRQNTSGFDYSLLTWGGKPDTLYHFIAEEGRLKPVFTIDFKYTPKTTGSKTFVPPSEDVPIHSYQELPSLYLADISFPQKTERENQWTTSVPVFVMVDKVTLKASYVKIQNDFLGGISVWPWFNRGHFQLNQDPLTFTEKLEKALQNNKIDAAVKSKIESLLKSINPEGNNVILIGILK